MRARGVAAAGAIAETLIAPGAVDLVALVHPGRRRAGATCRWVRGCRARGRRWPAGRTAAFGAGLVVLAVATQTGIARYDTTLFSVHVAQHVLLGMVAPVLLALGAPVTLALQAGARRHGSACAAPSIHPAGRALTNPLVAFAALRRHASSSSTSRRSTSWSLRNGARARGGARPLPAWSAAVRRRR